MKTHGLILSLSKDEAEFSCFSSGLLNLVVPPRSTLELGNVESSSLMPSVTRSGVMPPFFLEIIEVHPPRFFAKAEEAADANDQCGHSAVFIDQHVLQIADGLPAALYTLLFHRAPTANTQRLDWL